MPAFTLRQWGLFVACAAVTSPLLASPTDAIRSRIANYRELGAAFKAVNDGLRGGEVQTVLITQSARQIRNFSRAQYGWFPAGSTAQAGVKTSAKPEIWSNPAKFKAAQDAFASAADNFQQAVASKNVTAIRAEARKLGGTCKSCHDAFRHESD